MSIDNRDTSGRPLQPSEYVPFQEQVFEIRGSVVGPLIARQPHVQEEIVVSKDVQERTETVQGSVRRSEIDIQPLPRK